MSAINVRLNAGGESLMGWVMPNTTKGLREEIDRLLKEETDCHENYYGFNKSCIRTKRQQCEDQLAMRVSGQFKQKDKQCQD